MAAWATIKCYPYHLCEVLKEESGSKESVMSKHRTKAEKEMKREIDSKNKSRIAHQRVRFKVQIKKGDRK